MNKFIAIAGLAAISDAQTLREKLQLLTLVQSDLLTSVLDKLDSVDQAVGAQGEELDSLGNEQVIRHHHYSNKEVIEVPELGWHDRVCFEPFPVPSRTTLDFSASLSTPGAANDGFTTVAKMFLLNENGEEVARHETSNHPDDAHFHHSVALIHTEKVETDTEFTFCFMVRDSASDVIIAENGLEWGYKILGPEYNLIEHSFNGDDLQRI